MSVSRIFGYFLGFIFCTITAIDGCLRLLNSGHETGSLNFFFASGVAALLAFMLMLRPRKLISLARSQSVFYAILLTAIFFVVATVTVLLNGNVFGLLMELTYISMYVLAFLFFRVYVAGNELLVKSFFSMVLIMAGVLLPSAAFALNWFESSGRFEGFFAAASLSGNIAGIIGGYVVSNDHKHNNWVLFAMVLTVSIAVVVGTGTRSGLIIFVMYLIFAQRRRFASHANIFAGSLMAFGLALWFFVFGQESSVSIFDTLQDTRVVVVEDGEDVGSLTTRLAWIMLIFEQLVNENSFGGYGPGAAKQTVGVILHFDVLKTYYDYSVVGLAALVGILLATTSCSSKLVWIRSLAVVALLTLHNLLVSPVLLLFCAPFIFNFSVEKYVDRSKNFLQ